MVSVSTSAYDFDYQCHQYCLSILAISAPILVLSAPISADIIGLLAYRIPQNSIQILLIYIEIGQYLKPRVKTILWVEKAIKTLTYIKYDKSRYVSIQVRCIDLICFIATER